MHKHALRCSSSRLLAPRPWRVPFPLATGCGGRRHLPRGESIAIGAYSNIAAAPSPPLLCPPLLSLPQRSALPRSCTRRHARLAHLVAAVRLIARCACRCAVGCSGSAGAASVDVAARRGPALVAPLAFALALALSVALALAQAEPRSLALVAPLLLTLEEAILGQLKDRGAPSRAHLAERSEHLILGQIQRLELATDVLLDREQHLRQGRSRGRG